MSYKSPIEVITENVTFQIEDNIVKAVQNYGISVNKTELQKALMYDRKQYTQGFEDGWKYEQEERGHAHWELIDYAEPSRYGCSQCKRMVWNEENYCPNCGAKMDGVE